MSIWHFINILLLIALSTFFLNMVTCENEPAGQDSYVSEETEDSYSLFRKNDPDTTFKFGQRTKEEEMKHRQKSEDRELRFAQKYCNKPYKEWKKMQEADNLTLANICLVFFPFEKQGTEGAAEAIKKLNSTLLFQRVEQVVLDMIQCRLRYRNVREQITGEAVYYLAEGNEVNSAFKFTLIPWGGKNNFSIFLTDDVQDIWNQKIDPSAKLGSRAILNMDFFGY